MISLNSPQSPNALGPGAGAPQELSRDDSLHSAANAKIIRLAGVQYGDFYHTRQSLAAGKPETYYGQRQTVDAMSRLTGDCPHLIVSLAAAPYRHEEGLGKLISLKNPPRIAGMPARWVERWRARRIIKELEKFQVTHLLLRCNDLLGCELLAWARRRNVQSAVLIAARFDNTSRICRRFCRLANDPRVAFVANHNRVSTETLVECGLKPAKAIAWDYVHETQPEQFSTKRLAGQGPHSIVFAGVLSIDKGAGDLVDACQTARAAGLPIRLTMCGDGPLLPRLQALQSQGWLEATGRISQQEVQQRMRASDVVVVPSRHAFPEGLPLVLYEALATRTPVVLSDHPVFVRYFQHDNAVRFYTAADRRSLAAALQGILSAPEPFARLSSETQNVWRSLQCQTKFHDVLADLGRLWKSPV